MGRWPSGLGSRTAVEGLVVVQALQLCSTLDVRVVLTVRVVVFCYVDVQRRADAKDVLSYIRLLFGAERSLRWRGQHPSLVNQPCTCCMYGG